MTQYARIDSGHVVEVVTLPDGMTPADYFVEEIANAFVECSSDVADGWTYDGTTFAAPVVPTPPLPTEDAYRAAVQSVVDATAQSKQFNDAVTIASYVGSTIAAWADQAKAFVAWRDQVWVYSNAEMAKVEAKTRTQPTVEEFLTELPVITWPAA